MHFQLQLWSTFFGGKVTGLVVLREGRQPDWSLSGFGSGSRLTPIGNLDALDRNGSLMNPSELDFSGKTVLVVGGSSGIGNAIAQAFRAKGAVVHVWGPRPTAADYADNADSDLAGLPSKAWEALILEAQRRADRAGHYRYGLPQAYGGRPGSTLELAVIREHLNAKGLGLHNEAAAERSVVANARPLPAQLIIEHGTQALKDELLEPLLSGETLLAIAITEPGHGSDATHMETTAVREGSHGGDWVINGQKTWNSSVNAASHDIVFVRSHGQAGDA